MMKVRNISLAWGWMAALTLAGHSSFAQNATYPQNATYAGLPTNAATPIAASAPTAVPSLVPYSGTVALEEGKPLAGEIGVTFQIFKDEAGGEPLWAETQRVAVDSTGRYKAQLGATNPNGLPPDLFATGEARWLEAQVAGQVAQPRVLLASVPYALKAGDATTLGGLPASAFALVGSAPRQGAAEAAKVAPDTASTVTTTGGVGNYVAKFSGATTIVDSLLYDNGTAVGIGTTNPGGTLDVHGSTTFHGSASVETIGTATATTGYDSNTLNFFGSAYDSTTKAGVFPSFSWQAEPTGNNTASPGATLNLLSSNGVAGSAETGLHINGNGTINFAAGQTFPGTGPGTITGVTAGTALTGGGTSGNVTLNLDLTKVPELAAANTFSTSQTINGDLNLPATSSKNSGALNIGGVPFLHGYASGKSNVFVGDAGNFTTTGNDTTAAGFSALVAQTTGYENTSVGYASLYADTTGFYNTAVGTEALLSNTTGASNTAIGAFSGPTVSALSNTTAVGVNAKVAQSSSLVLGNTSATSPGAEFVNVGIGTAKPASALEISVNAPGAVGPALTLTNGVSNGTNYQDGNAAAINFYTYPVASSVQPGAQIKSVDNGNDDGYFSTDNLVFSSEYPDGAYSFLQQNLIIYSGGQIVVGTDPQDSSAPNNAQLTILQPYPSNQSGINTIGSSSSNPGNGLVATGGLNTYPTSTIPEGGIGGVFVGGDGDGGGTGGDAILAETNPDTLQKSPGFAGVFDGDVLIAGTLFADLKYFKIDHPLDPANKYLLHTSVESSELLNIYSGNVTTDELGMATVTLPDWFEAENTDFRYQLTTIGRDAHAWISQEVADKQFKISTNATNVKVSWQITAVRQDAYAKAHPIVVEQQKPANEVGFYKHPELYGQPRERQTEWGRHPQLMKQLKAANEANRTSAKAAPAKAHPATTVPKPTAANVERAEARPVGAGKP